MKARASCFGAGTIVNAIATGKGVAFGLALRASATAEAKPETFGVRTDVAHGGDSALALSAARIALPSFLMNSVLSSSGRGLSTKDSPRANVLKTEKSTCGS